MVMFVSSASVAPLELATLALELQVELELDAYYLMSMSRVCTYYNIEHISPRVSSAGAGGTYEYSSFRLGRGRLLLNRAATRAQRHMHARAVLMKASRR